MRVQKKTKHLHIEFIVTSHNSVPKSTYSTNISTKYKTVLNFLFCDWLKKHQKVSFALADWQTLKTKVCLYSKYIEVIGFRVELY